MQQMVKIMNNLIKQVHFNYNVYEMSEINNTTKDYQITPELT